MTEIIKASAPPPIEHAAFVPQASSEPTAKLFDCAYSPVSIAPHGPAYENWQGCPPMGGILQELPFGPGGGGPGGGRLQELPFGPGGGGPGGGGWKELPMGGGGFEKMPRGNSPYPMDIEFVGLEKCPVNKYLGHARGGGSGGFQELVRKDGGQALNIPAMSDGSRRAYSRVLK